MSEFHIFGRVCYTETFSGSIFLTALFYCFMNWMHCSSLNTFYFEAADLVSFFVSADHIFFLNKATDLNHFILNLICNFE